MSPFFEIGQAVTFLYFIFFIVIFPVIGLLEKIVYHLYVDRSIDAFGTNKNSSTRVYSKASSSNLLSLNFSNFYV